MFDGFLPAALLGILLILAGAVSVVVAQVLLVIFCARDLRPLEGTPEAASSPSVAASGRAFVDDSVAQGDWDDRQRGISSLAGAPLDVAGDTISPGLERP